MAYSDISTLMTAATTAMAAGDYAAARDSALAAQALLSITPDTSRQSAGGGSQSLTWDRVALSQFVDRVQKLLNSATGMGVSKVVLDPLDVDGVSQVGIW